MRPALALAEATRWVGLVWDSTRTRWWMTYRASSPTWVYDEVGTALRAKKRFRQNKTWTQQHDYQHYTSWTCAVLVVHICPIPLPLSLFFVLDSLLCVRCRYQSTLPVPPPNCSSRASSIATLLASRLRTCSSALSALSSPRNRFTLFLSSLPDLSPICRNSSYCCASLLLPPT